MYQLGLFGSSSTVFSHGFFACSTIHSSSMRIPPFELNRISCVDSHNCNNICGKKHGRFCICVWSTCDKWLWSKSPSTTKWMFVNKNQLCKKSPLMYVCPLWGNRLDLKCVNVLLCLYRTLCILICFKVWLLLFLRRNTH